MANLEYGYRSMCCKAPIRLGTKKKNNIPRKVWVCTKCRATNVNIVPLSELTSQIDYQRNNFSED